jgi:hypothetical protein
MAQHSLHPVAGANKLNGSIDLITGTAVLVAGTVTVTDANIKAGALCFITRTVDGGSIGSYKAPCSAGSVVITSTSGTDTSTVAYLIVNPN